MDGAVTTDNPCCRRHEGKTENHPGYREVGVRYRNIVSGEDPKPWINIASRLDSNLIALVTLVPVRLHPIVGS
jgi:hypothetical protein